MTIDSLFYLKKAKSENHLKPGENFAKGYHFVLTKSDDSDPIVTIYGTNKDGFISKIDFNTKTKSHLSSYSKLPSASGLYEYSEDKKNKTITEKSNAVLGSVFSKDLSFLAVWGYEKPGTTKTTPYIKMSDSKNNWETLKIDENDIDDVWFSEQFTSD